LPVPPYGLNNKIGVQKNKNLTVEGVKAAMWVNLLIQTASHLNQLLTPFLQFLLLPAVDAGCKDNAGFKQQV